MPIHLRADFYTRVRRRDMALISTKNWPQSFLTGALIFRSIASKTAPYGTGDVTGWYFTGYRVKPAANGRGRT